MLTVSEYTNEREKKNETHTKMISVITICIAIFLVTRFRMYTLYTLLLSSCFCFAPTVTLNDFERCIFIVHIISLFRFCAVVVAERFSVAATKYHVTMVSSCGGNNKRRFSIETNELRRERRTGDFIQLNNFKLLRLFVCRPKDPSN